MKQLYDPDLTQWLQRSGQYIGQVRPAKERTDWILFLFEEIRAFLTPAEYTALLIDLQDEIQRLLDESGAEPA